MKEFNEQVSKERLHKTGFWVFASFLRVLLKKTGRIVKKIDKLRLIG